MSHEFDLINQYFKPLCHVDHDEVGIGDDGAVLNCAVDYQAVVVTDTLIEGVHFPVTISAYDIAWKALAVNLSDLAAMGATPAFFSLALSLPSDKNTQAWLNLFAQGLKDLASQFKVVLIGGDTTKGAHLSITITAQGWVAKGNALLRSNAQVGDLIYVSGALGESGLGLEEVLTGCNESVEPSDAILKLNRPNPRIALGLALREIANSAIDISDGFLADLTHILEASGCYAQLDFDKMPISQPVKDWANQHHNKLLPLTCGDDYELCFTAPPKFDAQIQALASRLGIAITKVGEVTLSNEEKEVVQLMQNHKIMPLTQMGYQHF